MFFALMIFSLLSSQIINTLQAQARVKAESPEVIPYDRGGFSDSTEIIDPGALHIEAGLFDYKRDEDRFNEFEFTTALFRLGLIENILEFRLITSGFEMRARDDHLRVGYADLTLGCKVRFSDEREYRFLPSLGALPLWTIPFGDRDFSSNGFEQFYTFLVEQHFTDKFYLLINTGPYFQPDKKRHRDVGGGDPGDGLSITMPYVFSLNYDVTPRFTLIGEVLGAWGFTRGTDNQLGLAAGFTYAPTDTFIFDITTFYGVTSDTPLFEINIGFGYKIL